MILCASPDPKEIYKTISTLEYGAKAKCIVRGPHTPIKDKDDASIVLASRLAAMDQFITKLQTENKIKDKECEEAHKAIVKKEEEIAALWKKLKTMESKGIESVDEDFINMKVEERTKILKLELEKQIEECKKMTDRFVELERKRMEETISQQRQEVEMLRKRVREVEFELSLARGESVSKSLEGSKFAERIMTACANEDPNMVMSMELDLEDEQQQSTDAENARASAFASRYNDRVCLSTVFEEEAEETDLSDEEVRKEVVEEKRVCSSNQESSLSYEPKFGDQDSDSSRQMRIQNIFTLCGGYRELTQNLIPHSEQEILSTYSAVTKPSMESTKLASKENNSPLSSVNADEVEVFVKWEASKENAGKFITTLKLKKNATLADARKLIEIQLAGDNNTPFAFLVLGVSLCQSSPF